MYPVWLDFKNGGYFISSINSTYENIVGSFEPLGISIQSGTYNFNRIRLEAGTDASRKIFGTIKFESGNYFNGKLTTSNIELGISPIPQIFFKFSTDINSFEKVRVNIETRNITLFRVQSKFALNPRMQLMGLYQKNSQNNSGAYNCKYQTN